MLKIKTNSKLVEPGDTFVAIKGNTVDGHQYIEEAINKGARFIVAEHGEYKVPTLIVKDTTEYLRETLSKDYSKDFKDLKFIGITGTNGKTTTALLTSETLNELGESSAYIGTIGFYINGELVRELPNTTPDILTLYNLIYEAKEQGVKYIVMEVSSQALSYDRLTNINYSIIGFTNLTEDHLDYHKTMENYLNAKLKIIDYMQKDSKLIVNSDDEASKAFVNKFGSGIKLGYNNKKYDYNIEKANITPAETHITFTYENKEYNVTTNLTSKFNVYNYMTALAILHECGYSLQEIISKTKDLHAPKGRCETHKVNGGYAVIDYAHTPDAVEKVITAYNELKKGKLVIRKLDSSNGNVISNVEFVIMKDKEVIYEGVTNEYGEIEINNLPLGTYIIKEVRASNGYILNEDEIEVSLDSEVKYIEIFNIPDTEVRIVDIIMFF